MISKGLVENGHEVTVLLGRRFRPGPNFEIIDGINVYWSSEFYSKKQFTLIQKLIQFFLLRIKHIYRIIHLVRQGRFEWIICYAVGVEIVVPVLIVSRMFNISSASKWGDIIHRDGNKNLISYYSAKFGQHLSVKYSTLLINIGSIELETYFRKIAPQAKMITVGPPVDVKMFAKAKSENFRKNYNLNHCRLVTYIGGFKPYEGLNGLITAITSILSNNSSILLVIAGGGVESDFLALQKTTNSLPIKDQVLFVGQLKLQEVVRLLAASTVLVLPKIDHPVNHYAMPIKLAEYLASGKPVVASKIGGIKDYIIHGVNGSLFKPNDWDAFRSIVEDLLCDVERAKKIGIEGQNTAINHFDIPVIVRKLEQHLEYYR